MGLNKAAIAAAGGVLAAACLILTGCSMSRDLLDVKDGDRMTNPDAVTKDGRELISFSWTQDHTAPDRCFSLNFYIEDEQPLINGYFQAQDSGKRLEASPGARAVTGADTSADTGAETDTDSAADVGTATGTDADTQTGTDAHASTGTSIEQPWQLNYVQWFELQNTLADIELPEYSEPAGKPSGSPAKTSSESVDNASIEQDIDDSSSNSTISSDSGSSINSKMIIVWLKDGTEQTVILDGSNAAELESKVLSLAQQAHDAQTAE